MLYYSGCEIFLIESAKLNDECTELNDLLSSNRERLRRMIVLRLDPQIAGRVDESDIIQEAFVEASSRYREFKANQECSAYIWLRFLTLQKLAEIHRKHVRVKARTVRREVSIQAASSVVLANELMLDGTTPLEAVLREERRRQVVSAIDSIDEQDREILALRHYEHLTNQEAAEALGIESPAAYKRYVRALERLSAKLKSSSLSSSDR